MTRLIKRYDNRKLYDTHDKSYVCLEDLAALIRRGHDIQVLDNSSGRDITVEVLGKILLEVHRPPLPREVLHELVRWGGQWMAQAAGEIEQRLAETVAACLERTGALQQICQEFERLRRRVAQLEALAGRLEAALEGLGR